MPKSVNQAVFLDRDGVINFDAGYVHQKEDFFFLPGVLQAASRLSQAGWLLVVVTNQSGIARGFYSEEDFLRLEHWMEEQFSLAGARIAHAYFCPHHPQALLPQYRCTCNCRKPAPGMFLRAAADLQIDLPNSVCFGDKRSDMQAAAAAGVGKRILLSTNGTQCPSLVPEATECAKDLPSALRLFPFLLLRRGM